MLLVEREGKFVSVFNVELKKVVDDSYEIEIGYELEDKLISDLKHGLVGNITKFAVITDSNVKERLGKLRNLWKIPCWKKATVGIVASSQLAVV